MYNSQKAWWSSVWIDRNCVSYSWFKTGCMIVFEMFLQKATKKTDKPRSDEVEVTDLTDEDLKQQLAKHGVDSGPIVGEFPEGLSQTFVEKLFIFFQREK